MLRVGVGSKNQAKVEAVKAAFNKMGFEAEVMGIEIESNVSEQPFSDEETIQGAINRARNLYDQSKAPYDYTVGLEGGVVESEFGLFLCNWGAVIDKNGVIGIGGGHRVQLPDEISQGLHRGRELGDVIDQVMGKKDIKRNEGTIGVLTNGHITRSIMFQDVVICAFSRFLNPKLYIK